MAAIEPGTLELSDVSATGLLTAFYHAAASRIREPLLADPQAEAIADRLRPLLDRSSRPMLRSLAAGRLRESLVVHLALRARQYDRYARDFVRRQPGGGVVNLGCGLDARFWRIDDGRLHLYDLDLPEVIALKRELVTETDRYHLIARSVLDHAWMDAVGPGPALFLAEGLFMYLPPAGVRELVLALLARFPGSELVFEAVNSLWLRPSLRWMLNRKLRRDLGFGAGAAFQFGIRDGQEPVEWSPAIRFLEEWSYLDEDEPKLGLVRHLRHADLLRRSQWTVRYRLGA